MTKAEANASPWHTKLVRDLAADPEESVNYFEVRLAIIHELLMLTEQRFSNESSRRKRACEALRLLYKTFLELNQNGKQAYAKISDDQRAIVRQLAREYMPIAIDKGFYRAIEQMDRTIASAAVEDAHGRPFEAARRLRIHRNALATLLNRKDLFQIRRGHPWRPSARTERN